MLGGDGGCGGKDPAEQWLGYVGGRGCDGLPSVEQWRGILVIGYGLLVIEGEMGLGIGMECGIRFFFVYLQGENGGGRCGFLGEEAINQFCKK